MKVDFSDNIGVTPELAKAMLLHALEKRGAMLKELPDWTPNVSGKTVTMEGYLTTSGMKRLMSLFDRAPAFRQAPPEAASTPGLSDDRAKFYAQKTYFTKVADYVNDLQSNASSAGTFGAIAIWYDTYARKIGQLPVAGIDPELVRYAQRDVEFDVPGEQPDQERQLPKVGAPIQRAAAIRDQHLGSHLRLFLRLGRLRRPRRRFRHLHHARLRRRERREDGYPQPGNVHRRNVVGSDHAENSAEETNSTRQRMSLKYKENF